MFEPLKALPVWLKLWIIFPLGFLNGWLLLKLLNYFQPFIGILVAASIFAFLLDLPALYLKQKGVPRGLAISLVLAAAGLGLVGVALTVEPLVFRQLNALIINLPQLVESGEAQFKSLRQLAIAQTLPIDLSDLLDQALGQLTSIFQLGGSQLLNVFTETLNSLVNVLFFVVLVIFIILGGESAWDGIFSWLPTPWDTTLQSSIQTTFRRYFGTQVLLAGALSLVQTLGLLLLGVPYAVLFGVAIGLTTLVPYASAVTILLVSTIVALQDFSQGVKVLIGAIAIGQINDIFVSPRLMGETIGLNPIWLIAALFIGGKVGGFLGLIVAVPVASVIKATAEQLRQSANRPQALSSESTPAPLTTPTAF
jgi:predicted PurR-regulated permease PerM